MSDSTTHLKVHAPPIELEREPLVQNQRSIGWLSDQIAGVAEGKTPTWWWCAFIPSVLMLGMLGFLILYLMSTGVGVWGVAHPVMEGNWFDDGFRGTMGELLAAIEENREPSNAAASALPGLALCFAAVESARTGRPMIPGQVRALPSG